MEEAVIYLAVSFLVSILAGWLAYGLARRKGRSAWAWMIASALFVVPVLILAVLPSAGASSDRLPPAESGRS